MFNLILLILKLFFLALLYLFLLSTIIIIYRDLFAPPAPEETPSSPSVYLQIIKGAEGLVGKAFPLTDETVIGRSPATDIILDDSATSHRHARIFTQNYRYFIEDLGSTNGTFVEERKIKRSTRLQAGNKIKIGHTILQFTEK